MITFDGTWSVSFIIKNLQNKSETWHIGLAVQQQNFTAVSS